MKKLLAMLLALCMVFALCACGQTAAPAADPAPAQADTAAPAEESAAEPVSITLWTYPIGGWGNADTVDALIAAFEAAAACKGKPTVLIAKTTKGKGVSFMENNAGWHGKAPNDEQYAQAKAEVEAKLAELEGK